MKRVMVIAALFALVLLNAVLAFAAGRTEVTSMRTEWAKVYDNGNGTYTAEIKNHPIHKKNARGQWVDIRSFENGVGKTAVAIDEYDTYTALASYGITFITSGQSGYTGVGEVWSTGIPPVLMQDFRTAYLFYVAGLAVEETTDAYYVIEDPEKHEDGTINAVLLSSNPRWSSAQTVWNECGGSTVDSFSMSDDPITVEYASMVSDVQDSADKGYIAYGHNSQIPDNPVVANILGANATLYLTLGGRFMDEKEDVLALSTNPNPFNPITTIEFDLRKNTNVHLDVYNITGQRVQSLMSGFITAGKHTAVFNGANLASGLYIYRLKTEKSLRTGKMFLLK
jgi:hypothetical protein